LSDILLSCCISIGAAGGFDSDVYD
jgi:hypothetical protein